MTSSAETTQIADAMILGAGQVDEQKVKQAQVIAAALVKLLDAAFQAYKNAYTDYETHLKLQKAEQEKANTCKLFMFSGELALSVALFFIPGMEVIALIMLATTIAGSITTDGRFAPTDEDPHAQTCMDWALSEVAIHYVATFIGGGDCLRNKLIAAVFIGLLGGLLTAGVSVWAAGAEVAEITAGSVARVGFAGMLSTFTAVGGPDQVTKILEQDKAFMKRFANVINWIVGSPDYWDDQLNETFGTHIKMLNVPQLTPDSDVTKAILGGMVSGVFMIASFATCTGLLTSSVRSMLSPSVIKAMRLVFVASLLMQCGSQCGEGVWYYMAADEAKKVGDAQQQQTKAQLAIDLANQLSRESNKSLQNSLAQDAQSSNCFVHLADISQGIAINLRG